MTGQEWMRAENGGRVGEAHDDEERAPEPPLRAALLDRPRSRQLRLRLGGRLRPLGPHGGGDARHGEAPGLEQRREVDGGLVLVVVAAGDGGCALGCGGRGGACVGSCSLLLGSGGGGGSLRLFLRGQDREVADPVVLDRFVLRRGCCRADGELRVQGGVLAGISEMEK